jgi:membrane protein
VRTVPGRGREQRTANQVSQPALDRRGWLPRLISTLPAAASEYGRDRCRQHAAAISYHLLFALVPLFIFLVSVFGIILRDDDVRADLIDRLVARFPLTQEAGADLDRILSSVPTPASGIGLLSIAALLWAASGMMASVRVALTAAFDDGRDRPFFRSKLVDFVLVLSVTVLLLLSFGFSIALHAVEDWSPAVSDFLDSLALDEWSVLGNIAPPLLAFPAFLLLYRFVPPAHPKARDLWVGALVATLGFELVNLGFSYYLATVATWDLVYGSLGSILAFLFVVYLEASVFLFGAEVAAEWPRTAVAEETVGDPVPLRRRLVGFARGLFVRS